MSDIAIRSRIPRTRLLPSPSGQQPTVTKRPPRLYVLDGLRLIAALMVVAFHFVGYDRYGAKGVWGQSTAVLFPTAHKIASYGWLGVELFFLISGFVICMSCWGRTPRDFFVSRVVRLYPAFWVCVLTTAVVLRLDGDRSITPSRVLTNLTMLHEPLGVPHVDPAYWSLWAEMRFYLLFAVVACMGLTYRRVVAFCGIWLLGSVIAPISGIPLLTVAFQPRYAPFFVGGIVIYLMHRFRPAPMLWLLLGGTWLLAQQQLLALIHEDAGVGVRVSWTVSLAVITAFYAILLAAALGKLSFLNWRRLTTAGALTYPLYLLHEYIGWTAITHLRGTMPPYLLLAVLVAGVLAAAWAVHRLVERPVARRLKSWLSTPHTVRPTETTIAPPRP
ncbi:MULTISPECIES: acyltransferase family protein [unclassified Streptomyces]|uniref:acyltransferase family protein n=1 Tax=unclassified Streptomyces TaxID=2593676 RepID=UPI003810B31A